VQVNIVIMRVFVRLREILSTRKDIAQKLEALERKYREHDVRIQGIFDAIKEILRPRRIAPKRQIGFVAPKKKK
jgi:hypothetical protein